MDTWNEKNQQKTTTLRTKTKQILVHIVMDILYTCLIRQRYWFMAIWWQHRLPHWRWYNHHPHYCRSSRDHRRSWHWCCLQRTLHISVGHQSLHPWGCFRWPDRHRVSCSDVQRCDLFNKTLTVNALTCITCNFSPKKSKSTGTPWWRHQMETFPRCWPFVRGIHRSPVNFPHKGQWHGVLIFSFICAWTNDWANNREAGDFRRHRAHYGVIVMFKINITLNFWYS